MSVKLLTEQSLEFLSLKGGCAVSSDFKKLIYFTFQSGSVCF